MRGRLRKGRGGIKKEDEERNKGKEEEESKRE
jgi:hypothetical protein